MKFSQYPKAAHLRCDTGLQSFEKLISFYLRSPDRLAGKAKKIIVKDSLSTPDIVYAANALAFDAVTREGLKSILYNELDILAQTTEAGFSPDFNPWNMSLLVACEKDDFMVNPDACLIMLGPTNGQIAKTCQLISSRIALPFRLWEVPRYDPDMASSAIKYLKEEIKQVFEWLYFITGNKINEERLY